MYLSNNMIKTFPLNSRAKTTALKQPKELFSFARDIDGEYIFDSTKVQDENLSYYYLPDASVDKQIDLGAGYSNFKKIPEEENLGDFPALLKGVMNYEQSTGTKINSDIITFRGLMTKILTLPYNLKDPLDLHVIVYDGQLFIKNNDEIELKRRQQNNQHEDPSKQEMMKKFEYSGYKFEAVSTLSKPWGDCSRQLIEKRNKKVVNNYEQYISVVKTGIGKVKLLLAGEVDCLWDYIPEDGKDILPHYVELKTSKVIEAPGQVVNFEKKLFRTWAQSFLIGIRKIVYGFRDDNLILRNVEVYNTEEIPIMLKDTINVNTKIVCMNALKWYGAVIEWINNEIPKDADKLWSLTYDPGSKSFSIVELMQDSELRNSVITEDFKEWRISLHKTES